MPVIKRIITPDGERFMYYCLACNGNCWFDLKSWKWDLDYDQPTVGPSIVHQSRSGEKCHSCITRGVIEYLGDSTHAMAGTKVDMIPLEL